MEKKQQKEQPQSFMKKVMGIGIFGGLFWAGVWYFLHIFSFSEVGPNYFILPFAFGDWKQGVWGNILGIIVMGVLSLGVAVLYGALFKKFQGVIPGILYGLVWWGILFLAVGFLSPVVKHALEFPRSTLVTTICIFVLYGVFITYSVSYEAMEENLLRGKKEANYSNK
ncbi:MAG: YqhR family membrane protein [Ectobacillus sp.]